MTRSRQLAATFIGTGVLCLAALPASAASEAPMPVTPLDNSIYQPAPECMQKKETGSNTYTSVYNNCGGPSYDISVTFTSGGRSECATIPRGHAKDYQPYEVQDIYVCQ